MQTAFNPSLSRFLNELLGTTLVVEIEVIALLMPIASQGGNWASGDVTHANKPPLTDSAMDEGRWYYQPVTLRGTALENQVDYIPSAMVHNNTGKNRIVRRF